MGYKSYKDWIPPEDGKTYQLESTPDGKTKIKDVTSYQQEGDSWGAGDANNLMRSIAWTYKCTPQVDAWTGSDEAGWTQTVALTPYDGGPAVTDGMQLGPPMYLPTGVQATDEALAEVCSAINGGTSTPGQGEVALKVWEKPTADADIYFYGKAEAQA